MTHDPDVTAASRQDSPHGREIATAWGFVLVQAVLIVTVVVWPQGDAWPVTGSVARAGEIGSGLGVALMVAAAVSLRRGLTAAPLPNAHARLRTAGAYRFARHPIYTGLLLFTLSQVASSGSWTCAGAGLALVVLINMKARWEEERLVRRFADYHEYARRTPRFIPGWPTRSRRSGSSS